MPVGLLLPCVWAVGNPVSVQIPMLMRRIAVMIMVFSRTAVIVPAFRIRPPRMRASAPRNKQQHYGQQQRDVSFCHLYASFGCFAFSIARQPFAIVVFDSSG